MSKSKITPKVVKSIESALEERKSKRDRRTKSDEYAGKERRTGKDRRDESPQKG